MNNASNSLSFNQDMALVHMFSKEEVFSALPMMWKEKVNNSKTPSGKGENRAAKRKLYSPGSNSEDEDKKGTTKRRRDSLAGELSPTGLPKAKTPISTVRLTVPLSERQQMALLMQMMADKTPSDPLLHCTPQPNSPHSTGKKTPADRKVNKRNERGETPLHLAAIRGDFKLTRKLIKTGVDVNIKDYAGWTPLHEACNRGQMDVAKQLLKAGANVNAQGLDNDLPLHDAVINGHSKLVELLLKHGANPLLQNLKGKSPLDVASNKEIIKLMKSELVASNSSCSSSSLADVRSPTSPESSASERDDIELPHKLINSASDVGLLSLQQSSPSLPMKKWEATTTPTSNNWNNMNPSFINNNSSSPSNFALSLNSAGTKMDSHNNGTRLCLQQQQSMSSPYTSSSLSSTGTASIASSSSSPHGSSTSGISKKVHVTRYMDRSSSSPRLTIKFQKDNSNKQHQAPVTHVKNNASESSKAAATTTMGSSYSSYSVLLGAPNTTRNDWPLVSSTEGKQQLHHQSSSCGGESRMTWPLRESVRVDETLMRDNTTTNVNNQRPNCQSVVVAGKDVMVEPDDTSKSFSNQFEDISDAEDDQQKDIDMNTAAKMFGLTHIPSVSGVYQCHTNTGALFYDGNVGAAPMSSLPLLSGLNWSNIGAAYGSNFGSAGSNSAQFPLTIGSERGQGQMRQGSSLTENATVCSWPRNVPLKSSVKTLVPLSIDTNMSQAQPYGCTTEKSEMKRNASSVSDLLISLPSSTIASPKIGGGNVRQMTEASSVRNETLGDNRHLSMKQQQQYPASTTSSSSSSSSSSVKLLENNKQLQANHCDRVSPRVRTPPGGRGVKTPPAVVVGQKENIVSDSVVCVAEQPSIVRIESIEKRKVTKLLEENDEKKRDVSYKSSTHDATLTFAENDSRRSENKIGSIGNDLDLDCDTSRTNLDSRDNGIKSACDLKKISTSSSSITIDLQENLNLMTTTIVDFGGASSASVPRVPPLKIIIPSKNGSGGGVGGGIAINKDVPNVKAMPSKSSLPYVVSTSQTSALDQSNSIVDSLEMRDTGSSSLSTTMSLEVPVGTENVTTNRDLEQKEWLQQTKKRKFKHSCKGFGKDKDREMESDMAAQDTSSNSDSKEFVSAKGSCSSKESGDARQDDSAAHRNDAREKCQQQQQQQTQATSGMERRVTRSAVRSQQQKGKHSSSDAMNAKIEGSGSHNHQLQMTEKEMRDGYTEPSSGQKNIGEGQTDEDGNCLSRKHKAKHKQLPEQPSIESHVPIAPPQMFKKPTNPYEIYIGFKKKVTERKNRLSTILPKLPENYCEYLSVKCRYSLHENEKNKHEDSKLVMPNSLPDLMKGLFETQEKNRHQLRLHHIKERERLILLVEQETLRVQGRAARAMVGHGAALSACALLCAEEMHCHLDFDQEDKDQRSRYNGRQLKSWMEEIQEKFTKVKMELLSRHHQEADILHSVQKLDWEWKMKEVGLCDYHSTPVISEHDVPFVTVNDELDLPGT